MHRLTELRLGEVTRAAARFRPLLGVVAAALLVAVVLPNRHTGRPSVAASGSPSADVSFAPKTDEPSATPPAVAAPPALISESSPAFGVPDSGASIPSFAGSEQSPAASDVSPSPTTAFGPPSSTVGDDSAETPLTIGSRAWASREAGTPVATTGVPDGTLPVGNRVGQIDKASFVRLTGTATVLSLVEDPNGSRAVAGNGGVQVCRITTSDWSAGDAISFDQAPAYDTNSCKAGQRSDDGTWTFDLSGFADRAGPAGFALVPTADAPVDFQVAFKA